MAKAKGPKAAPAAARVEAALKAVHAYAAWMAADGLFPNPEYDLFQDAMDALGRAMGVDMSALDNEIKTEMEDINGAD